MKTKVGELMIGFYAGIWCGALFTVIAYTAILTLLHMHKKDAYARLTQEYSMLVNRYETLARRDSKLADTLEETRKIAHEAVTDKHDAINGRVVASENWERVSWP